MSRRLALLLALLCLLVAAALRLPALTTVPPGVHFDEAANALLAAEMGLEGQWPLFITSYTGKEVLFFYAAAGVMRLVGPGLFALRLTAAFVGLLTVAATYWLARELFPQQRTVAIVAMVLLAVNFSHLLFSRLGFRAITQPLLQALAVAALWRGVRRGDGRWAAAGGLALGLAGYTYLAARLFPIPLGLALLPLLRFRTARRRLLIYGAAAAVVISPLIIFFIRQPALFWVRIGQVAPAGEAALFDTYRQALGMLFLEGDPYWRFNLPGRPLLSTGWGVFLVVGWLMALMQAWRGATPLVRAGGRLLALTPLFMLLPTALATGDILPSNLRAIGLLPFVLLLPAAAIVGSVRFFARWQTLGRRYLFPSDGGVSWSQIGPWVVPLLLLLLLAGEAIDVRAAYFGHWARRSDVFYETDADLSPVSRYVDSIDAATAVYVAARHYRHPTVALQAQSYDRLRWLPGGEALPLTGGAPAVYVYPHSTPPPAWVEKLLTGAVRHEGPAGPDGRPTFVAFETSAPPNVTPDTPLDVNFDNRLRLTGIAAGGGPAGGSLPVTLYWQPVAPTTAALQPFIHLEDRWGTRWAQVESFAYPAEQWRPGETIILHHSFPIPPGTPPDLYRLRVGFFDPSTGARLARLDGDGRYAGDSHQVEAIPVAAAAPPATLPAPPISLNARALPQLTLLGLVPGSSTVAAGSPYPFELWWLAEAPLPRLISRLELMRPDGTGIIVENGQPNHDTYPFAVWDTPIFLRDGRAPRLPVDLSPGDYTMRLRLIEGTETRQLVDLMPLTILPSERSFTLPDPDFETVALFGGEIRLLGYDLQTEATVRRLTLYWQAERMPAANFTVFVHLLRPDGSCCAWQLDQQPRAGASPTADWLPGEVIADEYVLPWPPEGAPGEKLLEIGLYRAENGQRLRLEASGNALPDALLITHPALEQ